MLLRPFALFLVLMTVIAGCATRESVEQTPAPVAPPLPYNLSRTHLEYYPDASKRAREQGRVVVNLHLDPSGAVGLPMQIDRGKTDAAPRLEDAAQKMLSGSKFETAENYKKSLVVSIVFELAPCGTVAHEPTADYRINICLDPSPYANFSFAEHPPSALEEQIHQILVHGDLADIDFLEDTLGLRFRVTRLAPSPYSYGEDHAPHVLVTPTAVPETMKITLLNYESQGGAHDQTRFGLSFIPVNCPDIAMWAARWKIPSTSSMDPHGYGSGTDLQWGGEHGIRVVISYSSGGGCRMFLWQDKESGEPFSSHTDRDLISSVSLVRGIGAIVASGDIRNIVLAARALHSSFTTTGPGQFGINYELQSMIPGIDPVLFEYSINDTGQEPSPFGAFFSVPPIPANRSARLQLTVDIYHLCMRREQLPTELHRRGVRFRSSFKDDFAIYVKQGRNQIRMQLNLFGGCVRGISISQVTDVKHALRSSAPKS
jgi:TonB family protein